MSGPAIRITDLRGRPLTACPDDHPFRVEVDIPRPSEGDPPKTIEITIKSEEDEETLTLAWTGNHRGPAVYRSNPIKMEEGAEGGGKFTVTLPFTKVSFEKSTGGMGGVETSDGESVSISYGDASTTVRIFDSWHTLVIIQVNEFLTMAEAYWSKLKEKLQGVDDPDAEALCKLADIKLGLIARGRQNVNNTKLWDSERAALGSYFAGLVRTAGPGYDPRTEFEQIQAIKDRARERSMEVIWREFKNIVLGFYMLLTSATMTAQIYTLFSGRNVLGKKVRFSERVLSAIDLASNAALLSAGITANLRKMRRKTESVKSTKVSKGVDPEDVAPGVNVDPWDFGVLKHGTRHARRVADKYGVVLEIRPANLDSMRWQGRGYPRKPEAIKQKTINKKDVHLGAKEEHIGLVGHFKPKKPTRTADMDDAAWAGIQKRYEQRLDAWNTYHPKMLKMQKEGQVRLEDGLVVDTGLCGNTGKPITGDYDLWAIRDKKTGRQLNADEAKPIVDALKGGGFDAKHGAHLNWNPTDRAGKAVDQAIRDRHKHAVADGKNKGESILVVGGRADGPAKTTFSNVDTPLPKVEGGKLGGKSAAPPKVREVRPAELQQGVGGAVQGSKDASPPSGKTPIADDDPGVLAFDRMMEGSKKRIAEFESALTDDEDDASTEKTVMRPKVSDDDPGVVEFDRMQKAAQEQAAQIDSPLTSEGDDEEESDAQPEAESLSDDSGVEKAGAVGTASQVPKVLAGLAGLFAVGTACVTLVGLGWWFFLRTPAAAPPAATSPATEAPLAFDYPPTPPPPTFTPSLEELLDRYSASFRSSARAWLEMGLPADDVASMGGFMLSDPQGDGIYSIKGVEPGISSPLADIQSYLVASLALVPGAEEPIFNQSIFECGDRSRRTVICALDSLPMPPGNLVAATIVLAEPIPSPSQPFDPQAMLPIPSGDVMLVYAFVVDRDGDPSNNFRAVPPYDWDYYQGTDTWYELVGDPEYGLWELYATDASRRPFPSTARAVIDGNTITFFIAAGELGDLSLVRYRMSAFQTDGSYRPEISTGDVTGDDPQQDLLPILETDLTVHGPPADMLLAPQPATPTAPTSTAGPDPTPDIESQTRAFLAEFSAAQEQQDVDFLLEHLGAASLARYGEDQCRSYLQAYAGTVTSIEVLSTSYPVLFEYATDGRQVSLPGAVRVEIQFLARGEPSEGSMHVVLEGGKGFWFTDCGEPLQ